MAEPKPTKTKSWRDLLRVHPAADLFPLMSPEELRVLGEDIKANGLKHPITIWCPKEAHGFCDGGRRYWLNEEGVLLDGRNRLDAMELVGLPVYTPYYKESWIKSLKRIEGQPEEIKQLLITRERQAGPKEGEIEEDFLARVKELEEDEVWEGETEEEFQERVEHYRSRIDLGVSHRHVFETGLPQNKKIPKTWTIANDPYAYVASANIHRRHLTQDQKRELIEKLLKADPTKSDRAIAKLAHVDNKTVAAKREQLEAGEEIPHQEARVGRDGKVQPAGKKSAAKAESALAAEDELGTAAAPKDQPQPQDQTSDVAHVDVEAVADEDERNVLALKILWTKISAGAQDTFLKWVKEQRSSIRYPSIQEMQTGAPHPLIVDSPASDA